MRRTSLAVGVLLTGAPFASGAHLPTLAAADGGTLRTYLADGTAVATLPATSWWSIGGRLIAIDAGSGGNDVVDVRDTRTGVRRFTITNGFRGLVLPGGEVAFWPGRNGVRDPVLDSLWIRRANGQVRRVIQLAGGEDTVLSASWDGTGRRAALASGNDVDLFQYDIWLRDRTTARTLRLTRDRRSRWPALRPDGRVLAFTREHGVCPGGVRASDVVLMTIATRRTRVIARGSCTRSYPAPAWLSSGLLVSYRARRTGATWAFDVVRIDAHTGARRTVPRSTGGFFSVSPTLGQIAFDRAGGGVEIVNRSLGTVRVLPGASGPSLAGDLRQ